MAENNKSISYTVKIELADLESDVIDKIAEAVAKKLSASYPFPIKWATGSATGVVTQSWNSEENA